MIACQHRVAAVLTVAVAVVLLGSITANYAFAGGVGCVTGALCGTDASCGVDQYGGCGTQVTALAGSTCGSGTDDWCETSPGGDCVTAEGCELGFVDNESTCTTNGMPEQGGANIVCLSGKNR